MSSSFKLLYILPKWYLLYSKCAFYEANLLLQRKETKFLVTKPTFEKLSL